MNGAGLIGNVVQAANVVTRNNLNKITLCTTRQGEHRVLKMQCEKIKKHDNRQNNKGNDLQFQRDESQ
jgi:hypothetical protein